MDSTRSHERLRSTPQPLPDGLNVRVLWSGTGHKPGKTSAGRPPATGRPKEEITKRDHYPGLLVA